MVGHFWELATTLKQKEMAAIPFTVDRITNARLVIVLDFALPGEAVATLVHWLDLCREVVQAQLKKVVGVEGRAQVKKLKQQRSQLYEQAQGQEELLNLFPIPVLIVCMKYDTFCNEDRYVFKIFRILFKIFKYIQDIQIQILRSMKRKVVAQAIRYIAHVNGALVQSCSKSDKASLTSVRSVMNHFVFGTERKHQTLDDSALGLSIVTPGQDTLEDIGIPRGVKRSEFEVETLEKRLQHWIHAVTEYYPLSSSSSSSSGGNAEERILMNHDRDENIEFPEAMVDAVRHQKRCVSIQI